MSHCNKSVPQGCNTVKTRLAKALIPLKPAPSVPQSCNTITSRLARALIILLKPSPAQMLSAKQKVIDFFKRVWLWEGIYGPHQANLVLIAYASSESRGTFRQKARSLASLNGWACTVGICHKGMLEDTNSLDGAHITMKVLTYKETVNEVILMFCYKVNESI